MRLIPRASFLLQYFQNPVNYKICGTTQQQSKEEDP